MHRSRPAGIRNRRGAAPCVRPGGTTSTLVHFLHFFPWCPARVSSPRRAVYSSTRIVWSVYPARGGTDCTGRGFSASHAACMENLSCVHVWAHPASCKAGAWALAHARHSPTVDATIRALQALAWLYTWTLGSRCLRAASSDANTPTTPLAPHPQSHGAPACFATTITTIFSSLSTHPPQ
jgi:hypothetical protein